MNRRSKWMILIAIGITLVGCGAARKEIAMMSQSAGTDVFTEAPAEGTVPTGFGDLIIKASIKTPLESKEPMYGKPGYPFLLNIDGQAVLWMVEGRKHVLPKYMDGATSRDPEAGEGMMYTLEKRVRLTAGAHKVFFALPVDDYFIETDATVKGGEQAALEFKPVYNYKTFPTRIPTFQKGIKQFEVYLNSEKIRLRSE